MLRCRALVVLAALLGASAALILAGARLVLSGAATAARITAPQPSDAEQLLLGAVGVALTAIGLWTGVVTVVCARDLARPGATRAAGLVRPSWVRSAVLRACVPTLTAVVVGTGSQTPVAADPSNPADPTPVAEVARLAGLPIPVRPVSPQEPPATARRPAVSDPPGLVRVVHVGECLWTVADDLLGGRATAAQVSRAWHVLYAANRGRVGPDPDLVRAGTRLEVPPALVPRPTPSR